MWWESGPQICNYFEEWNEMKWNSFYFYSTFYNTIVSRGFTESETQSQNPQGSTVARKNSILTRRNVEQDFYKKEKEEKERQDREI